MTNLTTDFEVVKEENLTFVSLYYKLSYMTLQQLYKYQDVILHTIFEKEKVLFQGARVILAGGTALARCYLKHRASYDLDFFVSKRFDPMLLQRRLRDAGLLLNSVEAVTDPMYASQLHGMVNVEGETLRLSIVEDIYADMFPVITVKGIRTEAIEGLYHRKLRTITGTGEIITGTGRVAGKGARQTARDLFDLYVLSKEVKPIMEFVSEINNRGANISERALESGIRNIPWKDLMDEFETLEVAEKYKGITAFDVKRYFDICCRPI